MGEKEPFESIYLQARAPVEAGKVQYRVYKNETESVLVEADNAATAVIESGFDPVYRVERETGAALRFMDAEQLEPVEETVPMAIEAESVSEGFIAIAPNEISDIPEDGFIEMEWDMIHPKEENVAAEGTEVATAQEESEGT